MNVRDRSTKPILLIVMILATLFAADVSAGTNIEAAYAKLPLGFERNQGQAAPEVDYLSRGRNATLFLNGHEAVLTLRGDRAKPAHHRVRRKGGSAGDRRLGRDGVDGVGVYRKSDTTMRLTDDFGVTKRVFRFTEKADLPVAGNWDGK